MRRHNATNSSQVDFCTGDVVQAKASDWLFWLNLSMVIPSFFVVSGERPV